MLLEVGYLVVQRHVLMTQVLCLDIPQQKGIDLFFILIDTSSESLQFSG